MPGEGAESAGELVNEGWKIFDGLGENPSAEAKQEAANQLEAVQHKLKNIIDTQRGTDAEASASQALNNFHRRAEMMGFPPPATPAAPGPKQPQTKSGAGGDAPAVAAPGGYPLPTYPGGAAKSAAERLAAIRKRICDLWAKNPGRTDPNAAAKWRSELDELINEMCLAEEMLIMERSGGYSPAEKKAIGAAYEGFDDVKKMLEDLGKQNEEIADLAERYSKSVDYYHGQLRAGAEGAGPGALSRSGPNIGSGIGLVVSEQLQRALIKAENIGTDQEFAIRRRLEEADKVVQKTLESRRQRGIDQINKDLQAQAGEGEAVAPFEIHKPASKNWQERAESVIHEMHGSNMSGRPPIKWAGSAMGERGAAKPFDVTDFAKKYCGQPKGTKVGMGVPRKAALAGFLAVAFALVGFGVWQVTKDDGTIEVVTEQPEETVVEEQPEETVVEEETPEETVVEEETPVEEEPPPPSPGDLFTTWFDSAWPLTPDGMNDLFTSRPEYVATILRPHGDITGFSVAETWGGSTAISDTEAFETVPLRFQPIEPRFPCGLREGGVTVVCQNGAEPLPDDAPVIWFEAILDGPIPEPDPESWTYVYALVVDQNGDPSDNFQAQPPFTLDLFQNTDLWFELLGAPGPDGIEWELVTTNVLDGLNRGNTATDARVIIDGTRVLFAVPASEFAVADPGFRLTTFIHDGNFDFMVMGADIAPGFPDEPNWELASSAGRTVTDFGPTLVTPDPEPEPEPEEVTAAPTTDPEPEPAPGETVEEFVVDFDAALKAGDLEFLFDRLHPVSLEAFGEEQCRTHLEAEWALASGLTIAGPIDGPTTVSKIIGGRSFDIVDRFTAPVELVFQGQTFDVTAEWALVDDQMHWIPACE